MSRHVLTVNLRDDPAAIAAYREHHRRVWPEVIESLRACVPSGETVSAGIAQWDGAESGLELLARADAALYEAKRSGRDCTVLSPGAELTPA